MAMRNRSTNWRKMAAAARTIADGTHDPDSKKMMLQIAEGYARTQQRMPNVGRRTNGRRRRRTGNAARRVLGRSSSFGFSLPTAVPVPMNASDLRRRPSARGACMSSRLTVNAAWAWDSRTAAVFLADSLLVRTRQIIRLREPHTAARIFGGRIAVLHNANAHGEGADKSSQRGSP
jgi:hypothetical protein